MIFPMWPEVYRARAQEWQDKGSVIWAFLCVGIASWILCLLFGWDIFVLPGFLLPMLAFFMKQQQKWERDHVFLSVRINENTVDVIGAANDILKTTEHRYIRGMEVRRIRISQNHKGSRFQGKPQVCELIFLYIDNTYSFADLKLKEQRLYRGDENYFYFDEDVFFHPGCIAFDYNEAAWDLLSVEISRNEK